MLLRFVEAVVRLVSGKIGFVLIVFLLLFLFIILMMASAGHTRNLLFQLVYKTWMLAGKRGWEKIDPNKLRRRSSYTTHK